MNIIYFVPNITIAGGIKGGKTKCDKLSYST